jgi:hypothetical protein
MPETCIVLQKSGKTLMIEWNNKTKRIVMVEPHILRGLLYHDGPSELAAFLTAGWKEIGRGEGSYEQLQIMREMYREKLSEIPKARGRPKRIPVHEEEKD